MYINEDRVARIANLTSGQSLVYYAVGEESSSERSALSRKVYSSLCSTNGT
jgi:hypothetical protein